MKNKKGTLRKMRTSLGEDGVVRYQLSLGGELFSLNPLVGETLSFKYTGAVYCSNCETKTKKSFGGGYCYPCFMSIPQADMCVMKPETCHYEMGTCRDADWGIANCMVPHTVYLANSSGLKVGITREKNPVTRWMDQGAVQAIPLGTVPKRIDSGKVEVALKQFVSDKTNWRKMLKGEVDNIDLELKRVELLKHVPKDVMFDPSNETTTYIEFPVTKYPEKIKSFNLDKNPEVEGVLNGIKGQYLIFDNGVINIRKYSGYELTFDNL